jgi:hypothetical protein
MRACSVTALVFVASAILVGHVSANSTTYSVSYLPGGEIPSLARGWENVTIHDSASGFEAAGAAAPVTMQVRDLATGSTRTLEMLCTDVFHDYVSPGIYVLGQLSDTLSDRTKVGQIEALIQNGLPGATNAAAAAALQAAVWEIENEPGDSGYGITSGQFYLTGYGGALDPSMVADAQADLLAVETQAWKPDPGKIVMQFESAPGMAGYPDQSFAFVAPAPVPEPPAAALLAFGSVAALVGTYRVRGFRADYSGRANRANDRVSTS